MKKIFNAVSNESFIQNAILIMLTAVISGVFIPIVSDKIQKRDSHNDIILQSRAKLLDDITDLLFKYESLALDVSWYGMAGSSRNEELLRKSFAKYSDQTGEILASWRSLTSKARNLASVHVVKQLENFETKLTDQDAQITYLFNLKFNDGDNWSKRHDLDGKMVVEARELLELLAVDMNLKSNSHP